MAGGSGRAGGRWASLDVVRGLAALSVFLFHLNSMFPEPPHPHLADRLLGIFDRVLDFVWVGGGIHPGVVVFIVLSGFCIHLPLARTPSLLGKPRFWQGYAVRRFFRIAPVYWAASLLGILVVAFDRLDPVAHSKISMPGLSWTGVAITLSGTTALFQPLSLRFDFHPGNAILNTVAVEMLLYASYPALVALRGAAGSGAVFAVAGGLYLVQVGLRIAGVPPEFLHSSYLEFLLYWVLGTAAAEAFARAASRSALRRGALATACFLALFFAWSFGVQAKGAHVVKTALLALATAALLFSLCLRQRLAERAPGLALRWLSAIGDRSYSLYVVHMPVIAATIVAAGWLFSAPEAPGVRWAAAALAVAATEALYRGVERPSHRYALATARRISAGG